MRQVSPAQSLQSVLWFSFGPYEEALGSLNLEDTGIYYVYQPCKEPSYWLTPHFLSNVQLELDLLVELLYNHLFLSLLFIPASLFDFFGFVSSSGPQNSASKFSILCSFSLLGFPSQYPLDPLPPIKPLPLLGFSHLLHLNRQV